MKRIFATLGLLLCFLPGSAQLFSGERLLNNPNFDEKRWSWGYTLGFNTYGYDFDYEGYNPSPTVGKEIIIEKGIGFNVGLLGNLKLDNNLDLRLEPQVSFNSFGTRPTYSGQIDEVNSTFVHVPLLLKFSANRMNNFKPFVVGGVSTSINLSSNENNPEAEMRMTTNNYYYEIGVGIDLYLYYFKLSPTLRGVFAINDELVAGPNYMNNIDKMSTRAIFLNFTFQ